MQHLKYIVRWDDQDGNKQRREYDKEPEARKARDWLMQNGATSVDIAVSMGNREIKTAEQPSSMFPTKQEPVQQGFL